MIVRKGCRHAGTAGVPVSRWTYSVTTFSRGGRVDCAYNDVDLGGSRTSSSETRRLSRLSLWRHAAGQMALLRSICRRPCLCQPSHLVNQWLGQWGPLPTATWTRWEQTRRMASARSVVVNSTFCGDDGHGGGVENSVRSGVVDRRRHECESTGC
jgi:hypothetical protein